MSENSSHTAADTETTKLLVETDVYSSRPLQPSKCRSGVVLLSCLWLQMMSIGLGYGLGVMYVEMIRVFQASRSDAALIESIYLGVMAGAGILCTGFVRHYGPGPCVIAGSLLASAGLLTSGFAVNLPMVIIFTGVVGGLGMCFCYLGSFITVSWMFHENPGVPLVILTTGSSIGMFVGPYLYEVFITEYNWNGAFMLISGVTLNCVPFGLLLYTSGRFFVTGTESQTSGLGARQICDPFLVKDIMFLQILSAGFLITLTGPVESWFLVDIMVLRGYKREIGSFFVSLTGLANLIGRVIGVLMRLYVRIPTIYHWVYICPVIAIGHVLVISLYSYWPVLGATLLYGISFGITIAQAPVIIFEAVGLAKYPQAIALMNFMYGLGNLFGGTLGGFIKDKTGSYDAMFFFAVACCLYISVSTAFVATVKKCCKNKSLANAKHGYSILK